MFEKDIYYCIPDLHGRYDLLQLALDFVYNKHPNGCELIFLGDYIDRGKENLKVLKTVMNPPDNFVFTCLLGNHEDMFIDSYRTNTRFYDLSAAMDIAEYVRLDSFVSYEDIHRSIDENIVRWMESLPFFYLKGKNVFAHAFYDDTRLPSGQRKHNCVWDRISDIRYFNDNQGYYLTHGHTPRETGPIIGVNKINLDTGAVFYNRLVIGEYLVSKLGPINFHEFVT